MGEIRDPKTHPENGILLSCQLFGEDFFDFLVRFFSCLDFQEAGNRKFELRDPVGVKQFNLPRLPASRKAKQLKNRGQNSKKGQAVSWQDSRMLCWLNGVPPVAFSLLAFSLLDSVLLADS